MTTRMWVALSLPMAMIAVLSACGTVDAVPGSVGSPVPEYGAVTLDGASVDLAEFRGQVVLLNVWATWCGPCREEVPALQALYESQEGQPFEVIGVSVDLAGDREKIRRFAVDYEMTYPIWHDPDDRVSRAFRARGVPETYLIDRDGIIRWRHIGAVQEGDPGLLAAIEEALAES